MMAEKCTQGIENMYAGDQVLLSKSEDKFCYWHLSYHKILKNNFKILVKNPRE